MSIIHELEVSLTQHSIGKIVKTYYAEKYDEPFSMPYLFIEDSEEEYPLQLINHKLQGRPVYVFIGRTNELTKIKIEIEGKYSQDKDVKEFIDGLLQKINSEAQAVEKTSLSTNKTILRMEGDKPLTPREGEVAVLLAQGLKRKEIADKLMISEETIKTYFSGIAEKWNLGTASQTKLMAESKLRNYG